MIYCVKKGMKYFTVTSVICLFILMIFSVDTYAAGKKQAEVPKGSEVSAEAMHNYVQLVITSCTTKNMTQDQKLLACYNYCLNNMKYKRSYEAGNYANMKDYALEAFFTGRGNCYRYASMFAYMAAELGYNVTVHAGQCISTEGTWTPHSWCVITAPDKTQLVYDLSFGDANQGKKNYFGIKEKEHDRALWTQEIWVPFY